MHNFRKLRVYQQSLDFAAKTYRYTASAYPQDERYGLTSQLRRCAVSIASNIAEGCGRNTDKDTRRFLSVALGSAYEAETQLTIGMLLNYADCGELVENLKSIQRQLYAFYNRLGPTAN